MCRIVNDEDLDALFRAAHSPDRRLDRPLGDTLLRAVAELMRLGPRRAGDAAVHLVFVRSEAAKARLQPAIAATGDSAILAAPAVAILAAACARRDKARDEAEVRNCTLQAASLILAARALGFDCRPLWRFDESVVDAAFFADGTVGAHFLCAIGYGDAAVPQPPPAPAAPREACEIL